jgi:transposase
MRLQRPDIWLIFALSPWNILISGSVPEDSVPREYCLRSVFNGLRYIVKTGNQWRFMLHDLPPWPAVYQQTERWIRAGVFEIIVEDLRPLLREFAGRNAKPNALMEQLNAGTL